MQWLAACMWLLSPTLFSVNPFVCHPLLPQ